MVATIQQGTPVPVQETVQHTSKNDRNKKNSMLFLHWSLKLKSPKSKSCKWEHLSATESSVPKVPELVNIPAFNSMTPWHHYVTMSLFCTYMSIFTVEVKSTGSWKHDRINQRYSDWCWLRCLWADQSEQTGYMEGGSWTQELIQRGNTVLQPWTVYQSIRKPNLVVTQTGIMNLRISIIV